MQEVYRQSSYYEGGRWGYADTRNTHPTFKRLLQNLVTHGELL